MNAISIQQGAEILETATVTEIIHTGSMSVYKGLNKEGNTFITVNEQDNKIILITTLSSGDTILIDSI